MIESNKYFQSLKGFCEWFYRDARTKEENILKQNNRKWKQNRKTCKNIIKRLKTVTSKVTKTKEHREADRSKQRKWPIKWQGCHQGGQGPSPLKCAGPLSAAYTIFVICSVSCSMSLTISHPHPLPCVTPMKKYCRRCCKKGVKTLVGARKWNNSNSTWPGHWDPVCHLCFCQTFSSRGGKKPRQREDEPNLLPPQIPTSLPVTMVSVYSSNFWGVMVFPCWRNKSWRNPWRKTQERRVCHRETPPNVLFHFN